MPHYTLKDMTADGAVVAVSNADFAGDDEAVHFCVTRLKATPQERIWIELREGERLVATVIAEGQTNPIAPTEAEDPATMATAAYWEASLRGSDEKGAGLRPHDHGAAEPPPRTTK